MMQFWVEERAKKKQYQAVFWCEKQTFQAFEIRKEMGISIIKRKLLKHPPFTHLHPHTKYQMLIAWNNVKKKI